MNITCKISITKDPITKTPFIYIMEQNAETRSGRYEISPKDLLELQTDISHHLVNNTNSIMGKEGNLHMIRYEDHYALKFSKQEWVLHIDKHDILPLYNEITRALADIEISQPLPIPTTTRLNKQQLQLS